MNARIFSRLLIMTAAMGLLLAAPAAQAQKPPKGDNYNSPVNLPLNGQKTIKNVENATMEPIGIEQVSCDGDNSSDNSVWFTFVMPAFGHVDIDSAGTLLNSATGSSGFVAFSVHKSDPGLTEEGCLVGTLPRFTNLTLNSGTYLVRIASDGANALISPSQYRVGIRVRRLLNMLQNNSWEDTPLGVHWKIPKAGTPPKVRFECPYSCGVRFDGLAKGKVVQKVTIPASQLKFKAGDILSANISVNDTGAEGADIRVILKIKYKNGKPTTVVKHTRRIVHPTTTTFYAYGMVYAEIAHKAVASIQLVIMSPKATDTFMVGSAELLLYAGTSVREGSPLPVPPPAP